MRRGNAIGAAISLAAARAGFSSERGRTLLTTLLDQGVVSAGSFVLNVLLARITFPSDYGLFVLAYSVGAFANEVQQGVLLEPILVFSGGKTSSEFRDFLSASLTIQLLFTCGLVVIIWAACGVWILLRGPGPSVETFAVMALALVGHQSREFVRKAFYAQLQTTKALRNDTLYMLLLLGGIAIAVLSQRLTAQTAFLILAVAGVGSSLVTLKRVGISPELNRASVGLALRLHWGYGRWMLATAASRWLTNEFYYVVTALYLSPVAAAGLRAVQNIFTPVTFCLAGLGNLLLPVASRLAARPSANSLHWFAVVTGSIIAPGIALYSLAVWAGSAVTFRLLYADRYAEFAYLIPLVGSVHFLVGLLQGPSLALRALNRPVTVFAVSTLGAVMSTIAAFPLAARWGLPGIVASSLLNVVIASPVWALQYVRAARGHWPHTRP